MKAYELGLNNGIGILIIIWGVVLTLIHPFGILIIVLGILWILISLQCYYLIENKKEKSK